MERMTLNEWIVYGDTGTSSLTMWAAIVGAVSPDRNGGHFNIPHDMADFGLCRRLWEQCGLTTEQLHKVKEVFPWWSPYIDHWDELVRMHKAGGKGMHEYMRGLRDMAYEIARTK